MNVTQIDRLLASVPAAIDERQQARLTAYADTATRCETRIQRLRVELERSLHGVGGHHRAVASEAVAAEPNETLKIACELDALERLQPRVDGWLSDFVASLTRIDAQMTYGDGAPA
jgi:hypothetical protein